MGSKMDNRRKKKRRERERERAESTDWRLRGKKDEL
jgi:hypothetical protein